MKFETRPISAPERLSLTAWIASGEAKTFQSLVEDEMQSEYIRAITVQCKSTDKSTEHKFSVQASEHIRKGDELKLFLSLFQKFSDPEYPFQRLKTL